MYCSYVGASLEALICMMESGIETIEIRFKCRIANLFDQFWSVKGGSMDQ